MKEKSKVLVLLLISCTACFLSSNGSFKGETPVFSIGYLLSKDHQHKEKLEKLIRFAVQQLNDESNNIKLNVIVQMYNENILYNIVENACELVDQNIYAALSPDGSNTVAILSDILGPLGIPLLSPVATDSQIKKYSRENLLLLSPNDDHQVKAIIDLLKFYNWNEVALIASDTNYGTNAIHSLQKIIASKPHNERIIIKSATFFSSIERPDSHGHNILKILQIVKLSLVRVIVLICEGKHSKVILKHAHDLGMLANGFVWIVTDGITSDPHALSFDGYFPSYYEGLLGISPSVDIQSDEYRYFKDKFLSTEKKLSANDLAPELILTYDALKLLSFTLNDIYFKIRPPKVDCSARNSWTSGQTFLDKLKGTAMKGISGMLNLTDHGLTAEAKYNIVNFVSPGIFANIGSWSNEQGLKMSFEKDGSSVQFLGGTKIYPNGSPIGLSGVHLRLGMTVNPPFAFVKQNCQGNQCWEGITPDTVKELAKELNFTYEIVEPNDQQFGTFNKDTATWNGLIGDLLDYKTDMIAMDLSVSFERKTYIDFSVSFMGSGISLTVKGESDKGNVFFFLHPFSIWVWVMIIISTFIMATIQNIFSKISPSGKYDKMIHAMQVCKCETCTSRRKDKEHENIRLKDYSPSECLEKDAHENKKSEHFSFLNAIWVMGSGVVGHGGDPTPSSASGRFIQFTWWLFIMLMTSLYTANLTAFITLNKLGVKIENAKDLLSQNKYSWGLLNQSFVESLLGNNIDQEYRKILQGAEKVSSVKEGIKRVREGGFVFIDETPAISYHIMGECNIFYVGGEVQTFDYAFGLPKNSPYTVIINAHLIKLREQGFFDDVWKKWDKMPDFKGCNANSKNSNGVTLTITNTQGIFLFLTIGVAISFLIILLELVIAAYKDESDLDHTTYCSKLIRRIDLKIDDVKTEWFKYEKSPSNNELPLKDEQHFSPSLT